EAEGEEFFFDLARSRARSILQQTPKGIVKASSLGEIGTTTSKQKFRALLVKIIEDPNHPLHALLDPLTGRLRPRTTRGITEEVWLENPEIIEAGHSASARGLAGAPDRLVVMSAYENRLISAVLEHPAKGGEMLGSGRILAIQG